MGPREVPAEAGAGSHGRAHTSFLARLNIDLSPSIPPQGREVAAADREVESSSGSQRQALGSFIFYLQVIFKQVAPPQLAVG